MDPLTDPITGNPGEATAQDSPWVASATRLARMQQQQEAALQLEQQRALMEQTRNQQISAQTGRALTGQVASGDASAFANNPAYSGQSWSAAPQEAKQHFIDAYSHLPEGGNGISEQLPTIWNEAQRNATGNPQIGLENLQPGQTAQVKMNGDSVTVGKPPKFEYYNDPATGQRVQFDPVSGSATVIHPNDPAATSPVSADVSGDPLGDLTPAEAATVKGLAGYTLPMSVLSRMPPAQKERLLQHAYAVDPSFDAQQYPIRQELKKSFTSGQDAANITSLNTVIGHIGRLSDDAADLHNRGFTPWNATANAVEGAFGNPAQTKFDQAKTAVASEMAKLFKGTGSPTEQGVREWADTISRSSSPEQFKAAIGQALELMQSRADALRSKYENGFQKPKDQSWLNTQSKAVLRKLGVPLETVDPVASTDAAQPPQEAPGIPTVTTKEQYDAMPSGTRYMDSKGTTAIKK